jgi:hypothetical protein
MLGYHVVKRGSIRAGPRLLTPERLDGSLLILARAALSPNNARRSAVGRGGASAATSAADETGRQRADFGLADHRRVVRGKLDGQMQNSYLTLETDPDTGRRHAILDGMDDTSRIINGVFRIAVRSSQPFPSPLTLIPSYPDLPMEDVYPRVPHTDTRELYLRTVGNSRIVYIPWDIDRTFWDVMCIDHGRLLRNAIRWAANEPQPVEVEGPGLWTSPRGGSATR